MIAIMLEEIFTATGPRGGAYAAGAAIFRQGAPTRAIFKVKRGSVEIVRHLADGAKVTIATARDGDTFAEAALFADRYHCDALAQTDCEVLSAPTSAIRDLLAREPERATELAAFFAGQVRELRSRIEVLRIRRATHRLLAWLRTHAKGDPPVMTQTFPWANVASEIGLTPEALYRALRQLERGGAIERAKGLVRVLS